MVAREAPPAGTPVLAVALLVIGLLMPTSIGSGPNPMLSTLHAVLLACLLASPLLVGRAPFWAGGAAVSLALVAILLGATLISPTTQFAVGAIVPFAALAAILATDYTRIPLGPAMRTALIAMNILVLVAAAGVVSANSVVNDAIVRFASIAEPDLVPNMTEWRKPVFTFGSHSTAALGCYLLFLMQLRSHAVLGGRVHLVLAILTLVAMAPLTSASAVAYVMIGAAQLASISRRTAWLTLAALIIGAVVAGVLLVSLAGSAWQEALRLAFGADDGGFRARYAAGGAIRGNLDFIVQHPFRPIGLGYDPRLFFGDSGPVEMLLRGSVPLLLVVYGGLVIAVRRAIPSWRTAAALLGAIALFELGFSSLTFSRLAYLLCFTILYLRWLSLAPTETRG